MVRRRRRERNDDPEDDSDAAQRRLVRSTAARHSWTNRRQAALERVHSRQRQLVAQVRPDAALVFSEHHSRSADALPFVPDGFHDSHQVSPVPYQARYGVLMHHRALCASEAPLCTSSNCS